MMNSKMKCVSHCFDCVPKDSHWVTALSFNLWISALWSFNCIRSLFLNNIELKDSTSLRNFISSCSCIEDLSLQSYVFRDLKILSVCSANLKNLIINNGCNDHGGDGLENCELKGLCRSLTSMHITSPLAKRNL